MVVMETIGVVDGRGSEELILRLLRHYQGRQPHPPAFLLFSDYHSHMNETQICCMRYLELSKGSNDTCCAAAFNATSMVATPLHHTEEPHAAVASYYGFTHISHRHGGLGRGEQGSI